MFNPVADIDLKVNHGLDLVIEKSSTSTESVYTIGTTTNNYDLETLTQVTMLLVKAGFNTWKNHPNFGIGLYGNNVPLTSKNLSLLQVSLQESILRSGINLQNTIGLSVLSRDTIQVTIVFKVMVENRPLYHKVTNVYNQSTQELKTVHGFGE